MRLVMLLTKTNFWYFKMNCAKIQKICKIQWTNAFQMTNEGCDSIANRQKIHPIKVQNRPVEVRVKHINIYIYICFEPTLKEPMLPNFSSIIEEYPQLHKKVIKIFIFFSHHLFLWGQDFLHIFKPKQLLTRDQERDRLQLSNRKRVIW